MHTLLIFNQTAGRGQAKKIWSPLVELFTAHGMRVTAVSTKGQGDAETQTRQLAAGYDLLVCVGGDGTLHETIDGLMQIEQRPPLGYIPIGTTNDFAFTLRLPRRSIDAGCRIINGQTVFLDTGIFQDTRFTYVASFGMLSNVAFCTPQSWKNRFGRLAYFLEGAKRLSEIKPHHACVESDAGRIEDDFLFCVISNSTRIAGLIKLDRKHVCLNDGQFEVMLIRDPRNFPLFIQLVGGLLAECYDTRYITRFQTSRLKITCDQDTQWCLDGENGGIHKQVLIQNHKQSLQFVM